MSIIKKIEKYLLNESKRDIVIQIEDIQYTTKVKIEKNVMELIIRNDTFEDDDDEYKNDIGGGAVIELLRFLMLSLKVDIKSKNIDLIKISAVKDILSMKRYIDMIMNKINFENVKSTDKNVVLTYERKNKGK